MATKNHEIIKIRNGIARQLRAESVKRRPTSRTQEAEG